MKVRGCQLFPTKNPVESDLAESQWRVEEKKRGTLRSMKRFTKTVKS